MYIYPINKYIHTKADGDKLNSISVKDDQKKRERERMAMIAAIIYQEVMVHSNLNQVLYIFSSSNSYTNPFR